jgi:hypothetical protein
MPLVGSARWLPSQPRVPHGEGLPASAVRAILHFGGRFRFGEHVAAPAWSPRRWLQGAIRRPWAWLYEGCNPANDTIARLHAAGFSELRVERDRFHRSAFLPVNTAIWGIAVR